jgi:hypothetical protein
MVFCWNDFGIYNFGLCICGDIMTAPAQQSELRKVIMREPHKATALTDGWLCFKYLDNGEESISTFADISKGDVITYDRQHPPAPDKPRPPCEECVYQERIDKAARAATPKAYEEVGLNCFGEYQMNNRRCIICQAGERCYDKRQSLRQQAGEQE